MAVATAGFPSSSRTSALSSDDYEQEYGKILRVNEEIFTGAHPRLKVPTQFLRNKAVQQNTRQNAPVPPAKGPSKAGKAGENHGHVNGSERTAKSPAVASGQGPPTEAPNKKKPAMTTAPSAYVTRNPTSVIDPIFLTKSDDLVRAELQLERQREAGVLRDVAERKRREARRNDSYYEVTQDFSASTLLSRAREIVPSVRERKRKSTGRPPQADTSKAKKTATSSESLGDSSIYSSKAPDSPRPGEPQNPAPISDKRVPSGADYPAVDRRLGFRTANSSGSFQGMVDVPPVTEQCSLYPGRVQHAPGGLVSDGRAESPGGGYSPPPPNVPPLPIREFAPENESTNNAKRHLSYGDTYYSHGRPISPVRVVRNHITSPAAPQPSRVSPLTPAQRAQKRRLPGRDEASVSPEVPVVQLKPRKRRRMQGVGGGEDPYRRQAASFPGGYVKDELPSSPALFARSGPESVRREPPPSAYVDLTLPRYTPVPVDPRAMRVPSYVMVEERPERSGYYAEPPPMYARRHIIADVPAITSPEYDEPYVEKERPIMGPPERQIVVDEFGNEYYEAEPAAAPRPVSRVANGSTIEGRRSLRPASVLRAGSVVGDGYGERYGERRYVTADMLPPPSSYRRVTNYAPAVYGAAREAFPRSGSVHPMEYSGRRSVVYVDEPRERLARMPSVRPVRQDHGREMSVVLDDNEVVREPREYVERPAYVGERYYGRY